MPRLSKIGAACLSAFGFTTGAAGVTASYLVVAGGGGGGYDVGGGGGAGGYQSGTASLNSTLSYTVTVGAGGAGAVSSVNGANGTNSQFGSLTASVGGGGGASASNTAGSSGGSGGGGTRLNGAGGVGTSGQGNAGGAGSSTNGANISAAGGGGGAGAVGATATGGVGGNGGTGTASSITGSSVTYAGGGGGRCDGSGTQGTGGAGGGGNAGSTGSTGTVNTGGGGGGSSTAGGAGGSGIVIISYAGAQQFGGGIVTSSGGSTIHTFNTSGTLAPISSLTASYLIVAGGGGGACLGGGGGAGGMLTSSGLTIDTNSIYAISVGAGGNAGTNGVDPTAGTNSTFSMVTAAVGGGKGGGNWNVGNNGGNGGSGGGGGNGYGAGYTGGTGTSGQGNNGGTIVSFANPYYSGSGGGAGAVGLGANAANNGGAGTASSISGTSVTYAGGGGGTGWSTGGGTAGTGGAGGGGAGTNNGTGISGTANTGGGGGASGYPGASVFPAGGAGGSGIVIISYAGSVQQMAGGTVTISGGNVIHTFTTSGYLAPLKYVGNSLRFRSSASAYLNRTPTVAGNRQKWTYSAWVKRGILSSTSTILGTSGSYDEIRFSGDALRFFMNGATDADILTTQVFRDPAAWYHIVIALDTTQATASNRIKIYVNGTQVTALTTATYPAQNTNGSINNSVATAIGYSINNVALYFDGYMTEINMVDGQQLTPNSFGTFNSYGVWQPITYGGSYGTNGFYLPFTNKTSTTTLGYDFSPMGNNWTTNNISLTAGSTYDSMTDVPTLTSATVANYAVLNPLDYGGNTVKSIITEANLKGFDAGSASDNSTSVSTIGVTSGKFYCEFTSITTYVQAGILYGLPSSDIVASGVRYYGANGIIYKNGVSQGTFATYTTGDIIGLALDADAKTIAFYKNNTLITTITYTSTNLVFFGALYPNQNNGGVYANFGQRPFTYTAPSGFLPLNTYNI